MAVAHFMTVTDNAIRVQLPGGALYAPALLEAASKTGARSGLPAKHATALTTMVSAGLAVLNSVTSSTITLEMTVHDDSIAAKLVGNTTSKPTKQSLKPLEIKAATHALTYATRSTKTAFTIRFKV